jgi:hypothetical protein
MRNDSKSGTRRADPFRPGTTWIDALRQGNTQYQASITDATRIEILLFREACTLALLRRLLPHLKPDILQRLITPAPHRQPRFG